MSMIYGKGLRVFIVFCLVLTSVGFSFTASDVFTKLEKSETWLGGGYAIYTIANPTVTTSSLSKSSMPVSFTSEKTQTLSYNYLIEKNVSTTTQTYITIKKNCSTTYFDNKTGENVTTVYACDYQQPDKIITTWSLQFVPLTSDTLSTSKTARIKLEMSWKLPDKTKDGYTVARDWVPSINLGGTIYTMSAWAWANSTCLFKTQINYSGVTEQLNNFPFLLVLNSTNINYSRTGFADLQFYSDDGKLLPKELEIWNVTGNSYLWLKDNISTSNDYFEAYYNCSAPVTNDYSDVWDKNYYLHVYHFGNKSQDSSFYGENGTITGATLITTPIGLGYSYDGNDRITVTTPLLPLGLSNRTITTYVSQTGGGENQPVVSWSNVDSAGKRQVQALYQNKLTYWFYATDHISAITLGSNEYHLYTSTLGAGGTTSKLYKDNGAPATKTDHSGINSQASDLTIGYSPSDNIYLTGNIAEMRIENTTRSASWINATYLSMVNQFLSYGTEEVYPPGSNTVTLNYPNNGVTNTSNQIQFGYTPNFTISNIQNCSLYLNGTLTKTNATALVNNSINSIYYEFANSGTYNWSIGCWNSTQETNSTSRTLTLTEYVSTGFSTAYEFTRQLFNITFTFSNYTYSDVVLVYNESYYPASNLGGGLWNVTIVVPIVQANNTALNYYWNYTRDGILKNTTTKNQTVYWSFNPHNSSFSKNSLLSGESENVYLYVANQTPIMGSISAILQTNASANLTTAYVGYTNGYLNFTRAFNVPSVTANTSMNWTWYLIVNGSRTMEFTTNNVTITAFDLVDCGGGLPTLSYTTYDEQTWAYAVGSNYYAKVDIWSGSLVKSYSKQVLNSPNIEWCITPSYASFNANVSLLYGNTTDYPQRSWYWNNMLLSNVSQNISVYVLNTSHATLTNFDIKNQIGISQANVIVLFQKYNYTQGKYINMTDSVTTGTGGTFVYLEWLNTPYKILLYDRIGNLLNTYENYFIKETPITLRTTTQFYSLFYYFNQMSANCSWDNSTKFLSCNWNDGSGKMTRINWKVREDMIFQTTDVCNENSTNSSGLFSCYLGALTGVRSDYYSLTAYIGDVGQLIYNGYVNTITGLSGGKIANLDRNGGVVLALFIVMFMFFVGIWKPALGIAMGFAGFVLSTFLGLLDFGGAEFSVVGILLALTIFMIWRMRV